MGEKFVYDAEIGDNTKFVYISKTEQKAKFVYKELYAIGFGTPEIKIYKKKTIQCKEAKNGKLSSKDV